MHSSPCQTEASLVSRDDPLRRLVTYFDGLSHPPRARSPPELFQSLKTIGRMALLHF